MQPFPDHVPPRTVQQMLEYLEPTGSKAVPWGTKVDFESSERRKSRTGSPSGRFQFCPQRNQNQFMIVLRSWCGGECRFPGSCPLVFAPLSHAQTLPVTSGMGKASFPSRTHSQTVRTRHPFLRSDLTFLLSRNRFALNCVIDIAIETNNRAAQSATEHIRLIETLRQDGYSPRS